MLCAVICAAGASAMLYMRQKVTETYADNDESTAQSEVVETGSLSTTVSGSGTLEAVGLTDITIPTGVEVSCIFYDAGTTVSEGDLLFSVDSASVLKQMKDVQDQIDTLDESLEDASADEVSSSLTSGVSGRVKKIFVEAEDDVSSVMYSNGALMTLSLDGYMAVDIETGLLNVSDTVTVTDSDGTEYTGTVDSVDTEKAVILVTDNGPALDETVTVSFEVTQETETEDDSAEAEDDSAEAASDTDTADSDVEGSGTDGTDAEAQTESTVKSFTGKLYIHSPLSITGYAGTVYSVDVSENESVAADTSLMTLTDTSYSANYDTILEQRAVLEETLNELIVLYREGGVFAPFSGKIGTISEAYTDYVTETSSETSTEAAALTQNDAGQSAQTQNDAGQSAQTQNDAGQSAQTQNDARQSAQTQNDAGQSAQTQGSQTEETAAVTASVETEVSNHTGTGDTTATSGSTAAAADETGTAAEENSDETIVLTLDPNEEMTVDVSVDETDILTMEVGQSASVTIDSIGEDVYTGTVTQIDTSASSASGVTTYTVQVTIPRTEQMLSGMSASVEIRIDGVDNALLVPSEAIHLTSSTAYVYTTYDAETKEYGGMTEVTTGLTDGSRTEIISGLKEGDTVWYEEAETTQESSMPGMGGDRSGMDMSGMNMSGMNMGGDGSSFQRPGGNSSSGSGNESRRPGSNSSSGNGNAGGSGGSRPGGN